MVTSLANMAAARLEYFGSDSGGLQPLIVHFTNGNLKTGKKDKEKIKFHYFKSSETGDIRRQQRRTVVAETDRMEYVGHNFGQFARPSSICKYLIGVYDEELAAMQLYDAQMFTLQPKVLVVPDHETDGGVKKEAIELSFIQKNDLLTEAFGSNKKKRAMMSRQRNLIDSEEVGGTVAGAVQNLLTQAQEEPATEEHNLTIPPFNKDAQIAAELYRFDDIITPDEFEDLYRPAEELQSVKPQKLQEWRNEKRFPEYILQHLQVLPVNSSQRRHQACCLVYLSYMMKLHQLNYKDLRKKDPLSGIPDVIQTKLFSMFTLQMGRSRCAPKRLKDKLVSYLLVLALMIDEYCLDCSIIMKDLKMSSSRLNTHLRAIGCVMESSMTSKKRKLEDGESGRRRAILKVPLPPNFPNVGR